MLELETQSQHVRSERCALPLASDGILVQQETNPAQRLKRQLGLPGSDLGPLPRYGYVAWCSEGLLTGGAGVYLCFSSSWVP